MVQKRYKHNESLVRYTARKLTETRHKTMNNLVNLISGNAECDTG